MSKKPKRPNNQQRPAPHEEGRDAETTNRHVYLESGFQIDLVEGLREEYRAANQEATAHNKRQLFWTITASGLLLLTAAFTFWQGCSASRQSVYARKQFDFARDEQRSFLQVSIDMTDITAEKFNFVIPFSLENIGRSTASKISIHTAIETPKADEEPSFTYTAHNGLISTHVPVYPGGKDTENAYVVGENGLPKQAAPELREELENAERYVVFFGRVDYEDRLGNWWIQFCGWRGLVKKDIPGAHALAGRCIDYSVDGGAPKPQKE